MIISIGQKSYLYAVFCVINKDAYYIKVIHTDLYLAFYTIQLLLNVSWVTRLDDLTY